MSWISAIRSTFTVQIAKSFGAELTGLCITEAERGSINRYRKEKSRVQKMHIANSDKPVLFYYLDMILSVGYRVNSKRGTQFRIWANRILKEHLVKGYTINQKRLLEQQQHIEELKKSIAMVERSLLEQVETIDEARAIMRLLSDFSKGLEILDDYDHETLATEGNTRTPAIVIGKDEFMAVVEAMRRDFDSDVFGKQKDASFDSSVIQIYQSFDGTELYPTLEHKAVMLLYLVVKNHSFVDGNKRIAAALLLYFLEKNGLIYPNRQKRIP